MSPFQLGLPDVMVGIHKAWRHNLAAAFDDFHVLHWWIDALADFDNGVIVDENIGLEKWSDMVVGRVGEDGASSEQNILSSQSHFLK